MAVEPEDRLRALAAAGFEIESLERFAYRPLQLIPAHAHILGTARGPG